MSLETEVAATGQYEKGTKSNPIEKQAENGDYFGGRTLEIVRYESKVDSFRVEDFLNFE